MSKPNSQQLNEAKEVKVTRYDSLKCSYCGGGNIRRSKKGSRYCSDCKSSHPNKIAEFNPNEEDKKDLRNLASIFGL